MVHTSTAENHSSAGFELSGPSCNLTFLFPENKLVRNSRKGVYFIIGLQGEALIEIDRRTYTFQRSTFVCLTPNHLLSLLSHSDDFRFEYLYFEYDFLSDLPLLLKADVSDKMGADHLILTALLIKQLFYRKVLVSFVMGWIFLLASLYFSFALISELAEFASLAEQKAVEMMIGGGLIVGGSMVMSVLMMIRNTLK